MKLFRKEWKRLTALLLALGMVLTQVPVTALADTNTGEASEYWIDYAADGFAGGTGAIDDPYRIETPEQFAYMAKAYSISGETFAGKYVTLTKDIDLSGKYWTSVNFDGYFDGKGHSVSNMQAVGVEVGKSDAYTGLFGKTTGGSGSACLANIKVINPNTSYTGTRTSVSAGGLVGHAVDTDIINCSVTGGSVNGGIRGLGGGLVGKADCTQNGEKMSINFCSSTADVTGGTFTGGIVGVVMNTNKSYGTVYINNCWSAGTMTKGLSGGIIGSIQRIKGVEMNHCFSAATVTANNAGAGGLVGKVSLGTSGQTLGAGGLTVKNSVALNPSISTTLTGNTTLGRIVANADAVLEKNSGYFLNNYASELVLVGSTMVEGSDTNGTNVTMDTLYTKDFWENTLGFDFSESGRWAWSGDLYYPELKTDAIEGVFDIKITSHPSPATAYTNKDALFGIQAEGGNRNYQYQWQYSTDNENWTDITGETGNALSIAYNAGYETGTYFRCRIADTSGHNTVSKSAKLSVINTELTVSSAKENLLELYQDKGVLTQPREAFALLSVTNTLSDFTVNVPFYYSYSDENTSADRTGYVYWTAIDCYALGIDPHDYKADGKVSDEDMDLISKLLGRQDETTGGFKQFSSSYSETTGVPSIILSLEMYFNGKSWGNEQSDKKLGRDAALEYFFSQIADYSSGGKIMGKIYTSADTNKTDEVINSQRMQTEAISLLARLSDDPVYGERAAQIMPEMLEAMKALYDNGMITYTENMAGYVSALVAAAGAVQDEAAKTQYMNLAKTVITDKLFNSEAFDGSYGLTVSVRDLTGDKDATVAVMMALGDYTNGYSILASYEYNVSDKNSVQNDLNLITLPSMVTENMVLPDSGIFGSQITWKSSNTDSIKNDGIVLRGSEDVAVVLTATAVKGEKSTTRKFTVIVKADTDADSDAIDSALSETKVWFEAIGDITVPSSPVEGVDYSWKSSLPDVLSADGKVTRPAIGSEDATVTLTVTATKGSVTKTKDFTVLVYALTDTATNEGMVKEAAYRTRAYFLGNRVLKGYWSVWVAYSALGDFIQDPDNGYVYDTTGNTQLGAHILAVVAMGENPYNYNGQNLISNLIEGGVNGAWSVPVFNALGLEAAGSDYGSIPVSASIGWMTNLDMGPDIGGWGAVVASRHLNDKYSATASKAMDTFKTTLSTDMASGSMGSPGLSYGCVITGFTSFIAAGLTGYDVTKDSPWIEQQPIKVMYNNFIGGETGVNVSFNSQYMMEFCDLYNTLYKGGNVGWISCGVSKEKLETQKVKAQEILDKSYIYAPESISEINEALEQVNSISEDRLNTSVANYGEEYYTLYDAVRYAQLSGADSDKDIAAVVEDKISSLPSVDNLKLTDEAAVILARQAYTELTSRQKGMISTDAVSKLEALEARMVVLKLLGITISGGYSDDYILNVEALPENDDRYLAVTEALNKAVSELNQGKTIDGMSDEIAGAIKNGKLLVLYNLTIYDTYLGEYVEKLEDGLKFSIPIPEGTSYDSYLIVHMKSDGTLEYVIPQIIDGKLVFSLSSLSPVGVIGYNQADVQAVGTTSTLKAASTGDESRPYVYMGAAALAICAFAVTAGYTARRKKRL